MLDYLYDLNREYRRDMMRAADKWRLEQSILRHSRKLGAHRRLIGWTGRRLIAVGHTLQQISDAATYDPLYPPAQSQAK